MGGIISSNRVRPVEATPLTARERLIFDMKKVKPFQVVELTHGGHQLRTASFVENNNRR